MGSSPAGALSALAGVRILSLAEQYPGPFATMILADLGADVLLVERPDGGDPTRRFSGHFEGLNRGKRSIAVDLKSEAGAQVLWKLIDTADVLIEGFRPGVMHRLGFGADHVRARYPELIYCSISSFGQSGPLRRQAGHDLAAQGMSGFVSGDSLPEPAPLPLADLSSAMFSVIAVLTALLERRRSGNGTRVDIAMLDCLLAWRSATLVASLNGMRAAPYPPQDPGYGVFRTNDGQFVTISIAGEDHQWRVLCDELGLTNLANLTTAEREEARSSIQAALQAAILNSDTDKLRDALAERGVVLGPVNDDAAVARNDQVRARGHIVKVAGDSGVRVVRQPIIFDGLGTAAPKRAPMLGEQTEELLREVGYTTRKIRSLLFAGTAANATPTAAEPR